MFKNNTHNIVKKSGVRLYFYNSIYKNKINKKFAQMVKSEKDFTKKLIIVDAGTEWLFELQILFKIRTC